MSKEKLKSHEKKRAKGGAAAGSERKPDANVTLSRNLDRSINQFHYIMELKLGVVVENANTFESWFSYIVRRVWLRTRKYL